MNLKGLPLHLPAFAFFSPGVSTLVSVLSTCRSTCCYLLGFKQFDRCGTFAPSRRCKVLSDKDALRERHVNNRGNNFGWLE